MLGYFSFLLLLLASLVFAIESLVELDYTSYNGTALPNGISQWLGVRFAKPPLGELRFAAPEDPVQNATVQQAKRVSNSSAYTFSLLTILTARFNMSCNRRQPS